MTERQKYLSALKFIFQGMLVAIHERERWVSLGVARVMWSVAEKRAAEKFPKGVDK